MTLPTARRTLLVAHRGDHRQHPENSLAAILAALDVPGCDGVEFDVRHSSDGVPVLAHDATLERDQARPDAITERTAAELEALGIARLDEVLAAVPHRAFLDIELKDPFDRGLLEVLAAGRGPELRNAVLSSFDIAILRRVHKVVPTWPLWLNSEELSADTIALAVELECVAVSAIWRAVQPQMVAAARRQGLAVAAWTVTRRSTYARLAGLGLAAIFVEGSLLSAAGQAAGQAASDSR